MKLFFVSLTLLSMGVLIPMQEDQKRLNHKPFLYRTFEEKNELEKSPLLEQMFAVDWLYNNDIVAGGLKPEIRIQNTEGRLKEELKGHTERIYTVSALDNYIASGSLDKTLKLWDLETKKYWDLSTYGASVTSAKLQKNSVIASSHSLDLLGQLGSLEYIDLRSNSKYELPFIGKESYETIYKIDMNETTLVCGGSNKIVQIFDLGTRKALTRWDNDSAVLAVAMRGTKVAYGLYDGTIMLGDMAQEAEPTVVGQYNHTPYDMTFFDDEKIIVGFDNGSIQQAQQGKALVEIIPQTPGTFLNSVRSVAINKNLLAYAADKIYVKQLLQDSSKASQGWWGSWCSIV